jgi:hypothetical protein
MSTVYQWFGLKTIRTVFFCFGLKTSGDGFTSKPVTMVSWLGVKIGSYDGDLDLKITMTVSWFRLQNQTGFGLLIAP